MPGLPCLPSVSRESSHLGGGKQGGESAGLFVLPSCAVLSLSLLLLTMHWQHGNCAYSWGVYHSTAMRVWTKEWVARASERVRGRERAAEDGGG